MLKRLDKVVELVGGGSIINGAYPVLFKGIHTQKIPISIYNSVKKIGLK